MLLCASADGHKLPAVIMIPRTTPLVDFTAPANTIVVYEGACTFNSRVIKESFLDACLQPHLMRHRIKNPTLILDRAPCHKSQYVVEEMTRQQIDHQFVPAGFTSILQPADVSWMR